MVNGTGINGHTYGYWKGAECMGNQMDLIDQTIPDAYCTAADKEQLKAAAAFFGLLTGDDDFVPLGR